jgi:DNA ligase-associated metallophosphoesterase
MSGVETSALKTRAYELELEGEQVLLFPEKFAFWEKEKTIFLADTHFGKVAHFRKSGIGLPPGVGMETFFRLQAIVNGMKPERLIILGDVFHSDFNPDFVRFKDWIGQFGHIQFDLVLGNHDLAGKKAAEDLGLRFSTLLKTGPFYCVHEPGDIHSDHFHFFGHLHPGIALAGLAGQSLKIPCFWMRKNQMCFPAFGAFTGCAAISGKPGDTFFGITDKKVIPLSIK